MWVMKAATNAEAAELGARIRTLSGNIRKAVMGLCFGWGKGLDKGEDDSGDSSGCPFLMR